MESTKKELDQAVKTQSAEKKYNKSVEKNDPTDVQKGLHDNMVWEQTKSYTECIAHMNTSNREW